MKIKVKNFKEKKDGSAVVNLALDKEAKDWLIGEGFVAVLKNGLNISESHPYPKRIKELVEDLDGRC
jgi:hypothetical protein